MTSPSWPVTLSLPPPGYAVASMKRTSPPTAVTARPVATPGSAVRLRTSLGKRRGPSHSRTSAGSMWIFSSFPSANRRAALRKSAAIWRSRLRRPASRVYSPMTSLSASSSSSTRSAPRPCLLELARHEVLARDHQLLLLGVAREADDVHAVEQRRRDRLELVRGADEEDARQVERQVEVVVAEVLVLRRVEHLEHRARRDRRGSRRPSCRSRRSGTPGSSRRRRGARG